MSTKTDNRLILNVDAEIEFKLNDTPAQELKKAVEAALHRMVGGIFLKTPLRAEVLDWNYSIQQPSVVWRIEDALKWIREHQASVQKLGYHLALGGGVLNKGFSCKDLDLVLMRRTAASRSDAVKDFLSQSLNELAVEEILPTGEMLWTFPNHKMEFIVTGDEDEE